MKFFLGTIFIENLVFNYGYNLQTIFKFELKSHE